MCIVGCDGWGDGGYGYDSFMNVYYGFLQKEAEIMARYGKLQKWPMTHNLYAYQTTKAKMTLRYSQNFPVPCQRYTHSIPSSIASLLQSMLPSITPSCPCLSKKTPNPNPTTLQHIHHQNPITTKSNPPSIHQTLSKSQNPSLPPFTNIHIL